MNIEQTQFNHKYFKNIFFKLTDNLIVFIVKYKFENKILVGWKNYIGKVTKKLFLLNGKNYLGN